MVFVISGWSLKSGHDSTAYYAAVHQIRQDAMRSTLAGGGDSSPWPSDLVVKSELIAMRMEVQSRVSV